VTLRGHGCENTKAPIVILAARDLAANMWKLIEAGKDWGGSVDCPTRTGGGWWYLTERDLTNAKKRTLEKKKAHTSFHVGKGK